MTGVEQVNLGVRIVASEGPGARRQEERVVLAPYREQGWPAGADVLLESRVERNVALIVAEKVQLDLVITGTRKQCGIQSPCIRRQSLRRWHAVDVLPLSRFGFEECAQRGAIFRRRVFPVHLNRVPALAQALKIGIAVLRNDCRDAFRVAEREAKADRGTVIEDIYRI